MVSTKFSHWLRQSRFNQRHAVLLALVIAAVATVSAQAVPPESSIQTYSRTASAGHIRAGHILVRFKANPSQAVLDRLNAAFAARVVGKIEGINVMHLQVPPEAGGALIENLRRRSDVEFAEFDAIAHVFAKNSSTSNSTQATFVPNDPYYSTAYASSHYGSVGQWGLTAVSAPSSWAVTLGNRTTIIAIVDTGVDDTHPDLASKIVGEYSYVGGIKDGFGHGTHVAGIAAGATNNNIGIAGMCPNCGILSVKVMNDQGSGYVSDIALGITYAASHGARVISLSLGGNSRTETMHSALDYAVAHNALPVCAMGNSGAGSNTPEPAYWHDCLSVIATDQNGAKASFSNYGMKADVAAPGVAILSTMPTYPVTLTTNYGYEMNYDALSGTSMATPMVAGVAGLVISENPTLTPAQVAGIIEASAGDGVSWTPNAAFGVVNAFKAASSAVHSDYIAPLVNLNSPAEGAIVSGVVTVQAAPTDNTTLHHVDIVQNGTRFMQVLTGASTTTGSGKNAVTAPAWTILWPSTTLFNSSTTVSAFAVDVFGNVSAVQNRGFTIQNKLVSQSWTSQLCWPSSGSCTFNSPWLPVTTGVASEAATHLHGTVTYSAQRNIKSSSFWLELSSPNGVYYCGTDGTTVDCYPTLLLEPDGKNRSNYSAAQIDGISQKSGASEAGTVQWTLTYPQ